VPGVNNKPPTDGFWRIYVFPFEHLWFLQAAFLIFVLVAGLDAFGVMRGMVSWSSVILLASASSVAWRVTSSLDVFSVNGVLRLLPFFLLGLGMRRFALERGPRWLPWIALPVFIASYGFRLACLLSGVALPDVSSRAVSLMIASSGLYLLFRHRGFVANRLLATLGSSSFCVYLLHVFAASATRLVLHDLGLHDTGVLFFACLAVGIIAPVVFEKTVGRKSWLRMLLLGPRSVGR